MNINDPLQGYVFYLGLESYDLVTLSGFLYFWGFVFLAATARLTTTPCIVVSAKFGWSAHMEKIMMAQALGDPERQQYMRSQKILEINPLHPMVSYIKGRFDQDREDADAKLLAQLMYDTALLGERPTALGSAGCRCRVVASRALQWQALLSHMKAPLHQRGF